MNPFIEAAGPGRCLNDAEPHSRILGAVNCRDATFGWEFDTSVPVAGAISEPGNNGFVGRNTTSEGTGIPGGLGGGTDHDSHAIFYVGVPDVEAALQNAERLGGTRLMGPEKNPGADLVVGHFADPEDHVIGVAGPA